MQVLCIGRLFVSLCNWEKKMGSRPASPIGEARHSAYGERLMSWVEPSDCRSLRIMFGNVAFA
jgi:hypothetical protein